MGGASGIVIVSIDQLVGKMKELVGGLDGDTRAGKKLVRFMLEDGPCTR